MTGGSEKYIEFNWAPICDDDEKVEYLIPKGKHINFNHYLLPFSLEPNTT